MEDPSGIPPEVAPAPAPEAIAERRPCPGGAGKKRVCWAREGSAWCRNHDPGLAEQRRDNGARRRNGPNIERRPTISSAAEAIAAGRMRLVATGGHVVPGVSRVPHANPTRREVAALMAEEFDRQAEAILTAKVPEPTELRDTAIKVLYHASLRSPHEPSRVRAAQLLVALTQPNDGDKRPLMDLGSLAEDEDEQSTRQ